MLCAPARSTAQLVVDCHGDTPHPEGMYLENLGQKLDQFGDPHPEIKAYTQSFMVNVYALTLSRIAYVFPMGPADPVTGAVDLGKVWCEPAGESARQRTPLGRGALDTRFGFLDGRLAAPFTNVVGFTQERYENVWPNIDIVLTSNGSGPVLYFVCKVGSDPADVRLQFHGQDSLKFVEGEMTIYKQEHWIKLREATAYQVDENDDVSGILAWTGDWEPNNNGGVASLTVGDYDPDQTLVFKVGYPQMPPPPPVLIEYGTYVGGTGGNDFVTGMHADVEGNVFVGGHSASFDFPATTDIVTPAFPSLQGFVFKLDVDHIQPWKVYLGPSVRCIAVDEANRLLYAAGGNTNAEAYVKDRNPNDPNDYVNSSSSASSWLACMSYPEQDPGTLELVWATRFSAKIITAMAVQDNGDLWLTGRAGPFLEQVEPVVGAPWMQEVNYDESAFIAHFDATSHLQWSTWIGGWGYENGVDDWGLDIAVDEGVERVVVVGVAGSNAYYDTACTELDGEQPFPLYDGGHFFYCACGGLSNCGGGHDGFIALFNLAGERQTITYFGGTESMPSSVAFDPEGDIYVAGLTSGAYTTGDCGLPSVTAPYLPHCQSPGWFDVPSSTATGAHYLARFSPDLDLEWSTLLNAAGDNSGMTSVFEWTTTDGLNLPQVDVDEAGAVYFAASTFTGSGLNTDVPYALQDEDGYWFTDENEDEGDFWAPFQSAQEIYVMKISPEGQPVYATFFGGEGGTLQWEEYRAGGDLLCELKVRNDRLYIGGCTNSIHFLPLHWILPAFGSAVAPSIQDPDSPDQWNGFIADLSYLYNLDVSTGPQAANAAGFAVFPSPAEGVLSVRLPTGTGPLDLVIHDATGREVLRERTAPPTGAVAHVDISTLARGAYVISLRGGCMLGARFIKH